jgi:O-antigen ligase
MRAVKSGIDIEQILFRGFCVTFFLIPLGTSPFLIAGFLTLAMWVCSGRFIIESRAWLKMPWAAPLLAFAALHWIGLLYTADLHTGLRFASKTHYWLFAFAIASVPFARYSPKAFLDSFLAGLSLAAALHIAINAGVIHAPEKYAASFINPITYILLLTFGILILSFYFGKASPKRKILYCAGMLLYLASISLFAGAPGRTALLTLVLSTPLIAYNLLGQRSLPKVIGAAAIAVALLFTTPVVRSSINDAAAQVTAYYSGSPDSSVGLRLHMWNGAFRIFMDNPAIGVGTGGYQLAMAKYASPGLAAGTVLIQPHNSFLYMAVSFGAAGLISLAWLLIQFIRAGWAHMEHLTGFSILAFGVVVLGASLTDTQIMQVHTGMLFAMLTGLQTALGKTEKREGENEDKRLYLHKKCA